MADITRNMISSTKAGGTQTTMHPILNVYALITNIKLKCPEIIKCILMSNMKSLVAYHIKQGFAGIRLPVSLPASMKSRSHLIKTFVELGVVYAIYVVLH